MTDRKIALALKEMFIECTFGKGSIQCEGCVHEKNVCCDDKLNDLTDMAAELIEDQSATIAALRAEVEGYKASGLTPSRCAELAAAEREGRMVVLPYKVGDIAYEISWNAHAKRYEAVGRALSISDYGEFMRGIYYSTREEAENAIKE